MQRISFPDDALTADDRKALGITKSMPAETRERHFSAPEYYAPMPAAQHAAASDDDAPVTGTVRELVAMTLGGLGLIAILGGIAVFFAGLGDLIH